jgi:ribosomal protein S18 acetylase RimI-like enzyme
MDSLRNTQEGIFNIEDAKPEDVETLRTIVRDAWLELYPNETYEIKAKDISAIDWYNPKGLARRRKEIVENQDTIHTWVIKNEKGEVVGFCKASKLDTMGEIDAMYVLQELKGRGLGKKLMQQAFEWLGPKLDIKLKVVSYNTNAIEFYRKNGFKETGNNVSYEGTKLPNGKEIPRIEMVRKHRA